MLGLRGSNTKGRRAGTLASSKCISSCVLANLLDFGLKLFDSNCPELWELLTEGEDVAHPRKHIGLTDELLQAQNSAIVGEQPRNSNAGSARRDLRFFTPCFGFQNAATGKGDGPAGPCAHHSLVGFSIAPIPSSGRRQSRLAWSYSPAT